MSRLLWLKDPTQPPTKDNLHIYRFTRVLFGVISSPSTWSHHSPPLKTSWNSVLLLRIRKHVCGPSFDWYSFNSSKKAKDFYSESKEVFQARIIHESARMGVELKGISEVNTKTDAKTPFFRNNFFLAWECRGVSNLRGSALILPSHLLLEEG